MWLELVLFLIALFFVINAADVAIFASSRLSKIFKLSEFIVSFFVIAIIAVLPEATIAIIAAFNGIPELGLGALLGSNIVDLTVVFGLVAMCSKKGLRVKSEILRKDLFYLALLAFPVLLGFDGRLSRIDGVILLIGGLLFFVTLSIESRMFTKVFNHAKKRNTGLHVLLLIGSIAVLVIGSHFVVKYGFEFAKFAGLPAVLVGLIVVGLGTSLPELFFSIKAVRTNHEDLALGDILGAVIIDATIILGIVALISPFSFDPVFMIVTGIFMLLAGLAAMWFIRTGNVLTKKEGILLFLLYIVFVAVELYIVV